MKRAIVVLSVVAAVALLGISTADAAEELWVIKDGKLVAEGLDWPKGLTPERPYNPDDPFYKAYVYCGGKTVDGLYVAPKRVGNRKNFARFMLSRSALGDCEFKVVFSCPDGRGTTMPIVHVRDRLRLLFGRDGSVIWSSLRKQSLPVKPFHGPTGKNPYDGNLHSMVVKRVGDKISFYYDDKKLNEQPIDPDTNLYIWFDGWGATTKIKSMKLTAENLSDKLTTGFRSAAPVAYIYKGSGVRPKPVYGKACRYRIPALAVSKKGTILAFAEARRVGGADVGDIDAVVKRSEDGGKTWGPEILIIDYGTKSVNNHSPVVDPKTGRIWVVGNVSDINPRPVLVSYSDDDGKTWSKAKDIQKQLLTPNPNAVLYGAGPGAGIVLKRGKHAGRFVIPMNFGMRGMCVSGAIYSDDRGKTWKTGGMLRTPVLMTEARCAELLDGSLLFNARTIEGKRAHAIVPEGGSKDTTKRWLQADLPDPNCQGAIFRYSWPKDGKPGLILYSGPAGPSRSHGTLFGSYDDGKTWPWKMMYYEGGSGYSDACVLPDGRVAVLFEKDGKANLGFTIVPAPPAEPPK